MKHKILLAAGGTGGHVITAQSVAEALQESELDVFFAGSGLTSNAYFDQKRFAYAEMRAAPLSISPKGFIRFLSKTIMGVKDGLSILRQQKPSLVIGFGSYHTVPMMVAAMVQSIPFVLYEANAIPGRVVRLFAPKALFTACFFEEAAHKIRGKTVQSHHPLRACFRQKPSREDARAFFQLPAKDRCFLIIGGSQGADSLNALGPKIGEIHKTAHIIHLAGKKANLEELRSQYPNRSGSTIVQAYEENMPYAFAASDAIISRAGASTIAELELFSKPVIYIPYPYATDNHQLYNAQAAARRGPAVVVEEKEISPHKIANILTHLYDSSTCLGINQSVPTFMRCITNVLDKVEV